MDKLPGLFCRLFTILVLITGYQCTCDIPAAEACISSITVPDLPTVEDCDAVLEAVFSGSTCIGTQTSACDSQESNPVLAALVTLQDNVTAVCTDNKCADIGSKYVTYRQCLTDSDISSIIQDIILEWNTSGYQQSLTVEPCQRARSLNTCLSQASKSCTPLREQFGLLYSDHLALKQVQDICGLEIQFLENEGPIIADCADDLTITTAEVINQCAFNIDYTDNTVTIINFCRSMQIQIDCVVAYQAGCPRIVTNFLKPRLDTYATANTKFCGNITINDVIVKPIPSAICSFDNVFSCFFTLMRLFGPLYTSISDISLRTYFSWYVQDNSNLCRELRKNNFTQDQVCSYHARTECRIPSSTFGFYPITLGDVYDHELYTLLAPGPVPLNEFGAKFIGNRRNYICYDCDDYETMKTDFDSNCVPPVRTISQQINTAVTNGADTTSLSLCGDLTEALACVSNTSITCPLFYHQAEELLAESDVSPALSTCSISDLQLLPADFLPTTIPTTIPPTRVPTTRGTLQFSTSTLAPPMATTRNTSVETGPTEGMTEQPPASGSTRRSTTRNTVSTPESMSSTVSQASTSSGTPIRYFPGSLFMMFCTIFLTTTS